MKTAFCQNTFQKVAWPFYFILNLSYKFRDWRRVETHHGNPYLVHFDENDDLGLESFTSTSIPLDYA